jgi:hypothetical protein
MRCRARDKSPLRIARYSRAESEAACARCCSPTSARAEQIKIKAKSDENQFLRISHMSASTVDTLFSESDASRPVLWALVGGSPMVPTRVVHKTLARISWVWRKRNSLHLSPPIDHSTRAKSSPFQNVGLRLQLRPLQTRHKTDLVFVVRTFPYHHDGPN